jgi:hypothetical protein
VGGEWVVHQLEYLTEYGPRFGDVMATTPHRFYMMPLGVMLGTGAGILLVLSSAALALTRRARARLVRRLPQRVARHVPVLSFELRMAAVARTALVLAACQVAIYVAQENLEGFAIAGQWHGFSVLLASQHATVIPFHLLIAAFSALVLWTLSSCLQGSRRAVQMARVLVAVLVKRRTVPSNRRARLERIPDLRLTVGILCLRSPPLPV